MASDFEHHGTPIHSVRVTKSAIVTVRLPSTPELSREDGPGSPYRALVDAVNAVWNEDVDGMLEFDGGYDDGYEEIMIGLLDEDKGTPEELIEAVKQAVATLPGASVVGKSARRRVTRASPADKVTFLFKVPSSLDDDDAEVLQNALEALGWTTGVRAGETIEIDVPRDDVGEMSATLDDLGISFEKLSADEVDRSARRVTKSAPRWLEQFHQQLEAASAALGKAATILNEAPGDEDLDVSDRLSDVIALHESVSLLASTVLDGDIRSYESDED